MLLSFILMFKQLIRKLEDDMNKEASMQAQVITQFGEPDVFQTQDIPQPALRAGHILIRVAASSVNPADYKIRRFGPPIAPALPAVLHGDVAGVIEAVGEDVQDFKPGDEVYACAGGVKGVGGALAEFLLADAALVAYKPTTLTMPEAAALPLVSITAWEGLFDRAQLRAGQTVLIHGATGGVGHVAIQLAKWAGATVFATVSSGSKAAIARELGADGAINYREQSVTDYVAEHTNGAGFDIVFDTIGGTNLDRSFEAAKLNGTVVSISTSEAHDLSPMHAKGLSLHVVFMLIPMLYNIGRSHHGEILRQIATLVDNGQLRPLLDQQRFTFEQVAAAHRRAESGQQIGKVVLVR
jgi:NADPH:quinone reductase